jgi:hypothetical protein
MIRIFNIVLLASIPLLILPSASFTSSIGELATQKVQTGDNRLVDVQSTSGKISAIQDDTFTIEIQEVKPPGAGFREQDHISSMTFQIDRSTKIEGRLEVGANADVLYQRKGDNNVAVTVRVTAIS